MIQILASEIPMVMLAQFTRQDLIGVENLIQKNLLHMKCVVLVEVEVLEVTYIFTPNSSKEIF